MMFPSSLGRKSRRPGKPVGEFGDKFRKAREAKGISLDDVSNVTKIGARMLQAIEDEHFDQLPGGVFNKGFIRAYAKHLGLNSEEAVTDYLACLRQAQIDANEVWEPVRPATRPLPIPAAAEKRPAYTKPAMKTQAPTPTPTQVQELPELQLPRAEHVRPPREKFLNPGETEIPWRIIAVAALIIILAAVLWIRHSRAPRTESAKVNPTATTSATQPAPASSTPPSPAANAAPPSPQPSSTAKPTSTSPVPLASQPAQPAPTNSVNTNDTKNDVTIRTFKPATSTSSTRPAASLSLVIRATENSWISVMADGQPHTQETLIAPAATSVRATREIVVKVGNAAGVAFLWNGQDIQPQGAESEVKTFVFDASGMRITQSQPAENP